MKQLICFAAGLALGVGFSVGLSCTKTSETQVNVINVDYKELLEVRTKQLEYSQEMLHYVWVNCDSVWEAVESSDGYYKYDTLVGGDWEDFFYPWNMEEREILGYNNLYTKE